MNKNDIKSFAINFLAVFLGVLVTFGGEAFISSRKEKADVKVCLQLVKDELEENLYQVHYLDSMLHLDKEAAIFLYRYIGHYEDAPQDSLYKYCNVPLSNYNVTARHEALELLKSSSMFTKMNDMELSLDIIHAYGAIDEVMKVGEFYSGLKQKYLEAAIDDKTKEVLAQSNVTAVQLWSTITASSEGRQMLLEHVRRAQAFSVEDICNEVQKIIEKLR